METKYCYKCGKQKISRELDTYDIDTGKKRTILECPDEYAKDCLHFHDYVEDGFWKGYDLKCVNCGYIVIYPNY